MSEPNIDVRWANFRDAKKFIELNDEFNGVRMNEEDVIDLLSLPNELVALAIRNGDPIGFACAQCYRSICYPQPSAEITELYVRSDARRQGAAALLLAFLEEELKLRGVGSVKVLTGKENAAAIHVYESSKYIPEEEQVLQKTLYN